jgi:hypothetical protein
MSPNRANNLWASLVSLSLIAFAGLAIAWQCLHYNDVAAMRAWIARGRRGETPSDIGSSFFQNYVRGKQLAEIHDIVKRDQIVVQVAGLCRYVDLVLPPNARVFLSDMTGPTNVNRLMYYYYVTYYLFPREIGVSVDQPTRMVRDYLAGRTAESDQEILNNGYDAVVDFPPADTLKLRLLRPSSELPLKEPATPAWFCSRFDSNIAFLLPLLTALAGMQIFRWLFPSLRSLISVPEQLACSLGLGIMTLAALTLGIKLIGWQGHYLMLCIVMGGATIEIWRHRKGYWAEALNSCQAMASRPMAGFLCLAGLMVFLVLFRLAGLQGVIEYDGVMAWLLKAKIIHLYTGNEIVQWFSNPRLAHAHLDYPILVPALHSATFDSIGHVNEFVTKFWPVWMLLFLLARLASLNRRGNSAFYAPYFALLGLLLLPAIQKYVQMEGGTMPMIVFTTLGFVQFAFWLAEKNAGRLLLGLTLLFGAAMTKFEGFIFLALVGSWLLLVPSARPAVQSLPQLRQVAAFWLLAALPFICLRVQIPVLHYESGWASYAVHYPSTTLLNVPRIFMILLARLFVSSDFANWTGDAGQLHWIGRWDGLASLYNHSTLGLAWFGLLVMTAFWLAVPNRRSMIIWALMMLIGALAAFSVVFASFINITGLNAVLGYTIEANAGRYLLPVLFAWFTTLLTMFFHGQPMVDPELRADAIGSPETHRPETQAKAAPKSGQPSFLRD